MPGPHRCTSMTDFIPVAPATTPTERAIWRVLLYFEIFHYPLTAEEVFAYLDVREADPGTMAEMLRVMAAEGRIFHFDGFFQSQNDPAWVRRRLDCNRRAEAFLPIARRMARFIGGFPFIRAVFVSGSLSKHCMNADSDIDFFLIVAPGRLWLARTMLVFFKKIFLFNSHKYFCVNYFIDTEHLEIEEKNRFTATETVTLLPMYGREWFEGFHAANGWTRDFYPHFPLRPNTATPPHRRGLRKRTLEWLFGARPGDWLDRRAMRLTIGYWRRKFRHLETHDFAVAFKSHRHVSKHHPLYFQKKVLDAFAARLASLGI